MQINKLAQYITLFVILGMLLISCSDTEIENICAFKLVNDLDTTGYNLDIDIDNDEIEDIRFHFSSYSSASGNGASALINCFNEDWLIASSLRADTLVIDTSGFQDTIGMFSTLRYDVEDFNPEVHDDWDSIRIRTIPLLVDNIDDVQCNTLDYAKSIIIYSHYNSNYMYGLHNNSNPGFHELEGTIILVTNEYCYLVQISFIDWKFNINTIHRKCLE